MSANEPITRKKLLRRIDELIDRGGAASSVQPTRGDLGSNDLGSIVRTLVGEFSAAEDDASETTSARREDPSDRQIPVPLHEVAAYVDGTLDDAERTETITRLALSDPGLMMEIVAAVQSRGEFASDPPVAFDLRTRLLALHADSSVASAAPRDADPPANVDPADDSIAGEPIAAPPPIEIASLDPSPAAATAGRRWGWFIAACVAASVLFAVVGVGLRGRSSQDAAPVIAESTTTGERSDPLAPQPIDALTGEGRDPVPPDVLGATSANESYAAEASAKDAKEVSGSSVADALRPPRTGTTSREPTVSSDAMQADPAAPLIAGPLNPESADDRGSPLTAPARDPGTASMSQAESSWALTWTTIDGVLLRSDADGSGQDSTSSHAAAGVAAGTTLRLDSPRASGPLRLQTLPLCRAVAEFEDGGRLVLAADTQIDLTAEGTLDLQFGSFALLDIDSERIVRIGSSRDRSVAVQWDQAGELVVQRTMEGLQIDLAGGSARVAGKPVQESRLLVDQQTLQPEVVEAVPERLPRWTQQRVDRIELGRNVLASLADSSNVRQTLLQTLAGGQVQGQGMAILRGWLVASANGDLLELLASPDPLTRETALQHLAAINPRNPRHRLLWFNLQRSSGNPRVFTSIRSFFLDLWSGRRPGLARRDELLRLLQAPEPATRATAHFLLRSFFGPGPPFDIAASPQQNSRAANGWRAVMRRAN